MDASPQNAQPVCGEQVLELLNCTIESPYDKDKCQRLLDSLRQCVINKKVKKFFLAEPSIGKPEGSNEKRN
ncbi:putative crooked neck-like protein 1-like [Capsicum annuum]|uniref:CHCH domain-containing protein n=1 Tax=Capsicum annuum TaxID=4072 RepID=A0A2G2Y898_CAPAN|nr:putative crooked neck-like protein 1-like [Capsicum annuum]PHT65995.1 hypothetical protein T459_30420 [Capsicum annuum]